MSGPYRDGPFEVVTEINFGHTGPQKNPGVWHLVVGITKGIPDTSVPNPGVCGPPWTSGPQVLSNYAYHVDDDSNFTITQTPSGEITIFTDTVGSGICSDYVASTLGPRYLTTEIRANGKLVLTLQSDAGTQSLVSASPIQNTCSVCGSYFEFQVIVDQFFVPDNP